MKLTVLIPVYNTGAAHLIEAVDSILNQTQPEQRLHHEIILINDGSTEPETKKALTLLSDLYGLTIVDKENGGTSSALNAGHSMVKTEYVAIMGSDDISHPDRFKKQIKVLQDHPDTDVLGTNLFAFYDDDITRKPILTTTHKMFPEGLDKNKNWLVNHGTVIYRQSAVMSVGGYNEKIGRGQDVDLWKRMKAADLRFRNVTEVLYAWRRFKV